MMITFRTFADMGALLGGNAKSSVLALAALGALAGAWHARVAAADVGETAFEAARVKDDLAGEFTAGSTAARVRLHATAGSKLSLLLGADPRSAVAGAPGPAAGLFRSTGEDLAALLADRTSTLKDGTLRWKNVVLDQTGDYDLVLTGTGDGSWRLRLTGALAAANAAKASAAAPGTDDTLDFHGLRGGLLTFSAGPAAKGSKWKGEVQRILQPDGSDLPGVPEAVASGKVTLRTDGTHTFVFRNVGSGSGTGKASASVKPPKAFVRTGFVGLAGTNFKPVVTKIDPNRAFQRDDEFPAVIFGRDFQDGLDVRLRRDGRADIPGTTTEFRSETEVACTFDMETLDTEGKSSLGAWRVVVTNAPAAADPRTVTFGPKLSSVNSASIRLPDGVVKGAEVWVLDFNDDFQADLNRMGLGSSDVPTRDICRTAVEAYVVLFLRDLFLANESTGALKKNTSVPVAFVVNAPGRVAGKAGEDYNRIEVGGEWQTGDERDAAEPLFWGFAPVDAGNANREDLSVLDALGTRTGRGARIRALDPGLVTASSGWATAMQPLLAKGLTSADARYFRRGYFPANQAEADRYAEIVPQVTRAAREIAAVIGHHVGRAMGLASGAATGPMSNPTTAGDLWSQTTSLSFSPSDLTTLRTNAVPHALPGTTRTLSIGWFPLATTHTYLLEECTSEVTYSTRFGLVGGRPNAVKTDYKVQYVVGSSVPAGLNLTFDGLDGKVPLWVNQPANVYTCGIYPFRIAVTDEIRGGTKFFVYRLNVVPNVPLLPVALQNAATQCASTVRSTP